LLAGQDAVRGGTWLAVSRTGRIAAITNYREAQVQIGERSRGSLPVEFVTSVHPTEIFLQAKIDEGDEALRSYGGFSLLCGELADLDPGLAVLSNRSAEAGIIRVLRTGTDETASACELSNTQIDEPWPKTQSGRQLLDDTIRKHAQKDEQDALVEDLLAILTTDTLAKPDIPSMMGSIFIPEIPLADDTYGTRQQTVVLVSNTNEVTFVERTRAPGNDLTTVKHSFHITAKTKA
jgi:uncharacterized protein with NRDE domain